MGKLLTSLFWGVCPFIFTGFAVGFCLLYAEDDLTYWLIFLPLVGLTTFPFFVAVTYGIRMFIRSKLLHVPAGAELSNPELRHLSAKVGKWGQIAVLTWICIFLIVAFIAINFIRIERKESGWELVKAGQPVTLSEGSRIHTLLNTLDTTLHFLWPIPLIALVSGAIILFRLLLRRKRGKRKREDIFWRIALFGTIACFVIPILLIFALGSLMQTIVRKEVKAFLRNTSSNVAVEINKSPVENKDQIIAELVKVASIPAHHSHSTNRFRINVKDGNEGLIIELGRDSSRKQEYWVYYLGYGHTYVNEIGRITTSLFDEY